MPDSQQLHREERRGSSSLLFPAPLIEIVMVLTVCDILQISFKVMF